MCCAAFWLHDVHNVTFKGMILTVQTPNVSVAIFRSVSKVSIQWATTYSSHDHYCFGIGIREAYSTDIQSSSAYNCTYGVVLENTTNSQMNNTTAMYNMWGGVLLEVSDSRISNAIVIRESVDSLCRDGADTPIVRVHRKAFLTRERSRSKPFWAPRYSIPVVRYPKIPPK